MRLVSLVLLGAPILVACRTPVGEATDEPPSEELSAMLGWRGDGENADLAHHLEALRRYQPRGFCSLDTRPQLVASLRAEAAEQARRTGWAVQGWVDTIGYWKSERNAWSSYGQGHPDGHLDLLQRVGVAPDRLLLGLLIDLPGLPPAIHLADARRVAPELGDDFVRRVRHLSANDAIDPLNRARLFVIVAEMPFSSDPGYLTLPAEAKALIDFWSR